MENPRKTRRRPPKGGWWDDKQVRLIEDSTLEICATSWDLDRRITTPEDIEAGVTGTVFDAGRDKVDIQFDDGNIALGVSKDSLELIDKERHEENPFVDKEFIEEYREGLARENVENSEQEKTLEQYLEEGWKIQVQIKDDLGKEVSFEFEDEVRDFVLHDRHGLYEIKTLKMDDMNILISKKKARENTIYIGYPKRRKTKKKKKRKTRKTVTSRYTRKPVPKRTTSREGLVSEKRGRRPWWYLKPPVYVTSKRDEKMWEKACRRASQGGKEPSYAGVTQIYKIYLSRVGRPYVRKSVANIEGEIMTFECLNCEHTFRHSAGRDVKCPECGSYETNAWKEASTDIETAKTDWTDKSVILKEDIDVFDDELGEEIIKKGTKATVDKDNELLVDIQLENDSIIDGIAKDILTLEEDSVDEEISHPEREPRTLQEKDFEEREEQPRAEENRLIAVPTGLMFQKAYGWTKAKVKSWLREEGLRVPKNNEIQSKKVNNRLFFKVTLKKVSKDVSYNQKHLGEGVWAFYAKN